MTPKTYTITAMNLGSIGSRLRSTLEEVVDSLAVLLQGIPVEYFERTGGGVVFICPEYYWGEISAEDRSRQTELLHRYKRFSEILHLTFSSSPEDVQRELHAADKRFRVWLELGSNWVIRPDEERNEQMFREDAKKLFRLIDILDAHFEKTTILVPDTNSLLDHPDPVSYRDLSPAASFIFLLLPTVLGELDELKVTHRVPEVRDKAKKSIGRIKGWRQQGSLLTGVVVDRTITVRTQSDEPDMQKTLPWLDEMVKDDRIIASVLEVQCRRPAAKVILVTGDINLQTKAEAAMIEYSDVS